MTREQLEHVLRAAGAITGEHEFVLLGSQAALAQFHRLPSVMTLSNEIDLYPRHRPELADVVDVAIGRDSPFHSTFGYDADGIAPETAKLPRGWEVRAFRLHGPTTGGAVGICPELHDLAAAKLLAGHDKDLNWLDAARGAGLLDPAILRARLDEIDGIDAALLDLARARAARL